MSAAPQLAASRPIPYRPFTHLKANAQAHPDRPAIIENGSEISFSQLLGQVSELMALLRARGLERGDVAAVALPNTGTYVALEIAIPALGAVIMPLPPALGEHEISSALGRSGARLLVVCASTEVAARAATQSPSIREILSLPLSGAPAADGGELPAETERGDIVQIALTSGTTGPPKLAAFTAELKQVTFESFTSRLAVTGEDRVLPLSPITQGAGEMFLYCLRCGASLVMLGEPKFRAEHALEVAASSRATVLGGVPTMLARMLDCPLLDEVDLSSARLAAVAGAPLTPELARRWEERTGIAVASFYGAMDIGQLAVPTPDDPREKRWHTVGRPHERAEWAILSPEGRELPLGQEGEICMRGPLVQGRYWDQDAGPYADDGWAHFGDLGFVDEDGYLHVTGRVKDTIIRGGNNINPYEVEEIVRGHPAVAEVAVVGRPDEDMGERAVAFVVPAPGSHLALEELGRFLDERGLARYKWPEDICELEELPIGPTGKLLRGELRERAAARSAD